MNTMVQEMSWDSIANGEGAGIFDLSVDELEEIHGAWGWHNVAAAAIGGAAGYRGGNRFERFSGATAGALAGWYLV